MQIGDWRERHEWHETTEYNTVTTPFLFVQVCSGKEGEWVPPTSGQSLLPANSQHACWYVFEQTRVHSFNGTMKKGGSPFDLYFLFQTGVTIYMGTQHFLAEIFLADTRSLTPFEILPHIDQSSDHFGVWSKPFFQAQPWALSNIYGQRIM